MFLPTWTDMILLLFAFVWLTFQQLRIHTSGFVSVPRMLTQAVIVVLMFIVVFYNSTNSAVSAALSLGSVAALGVAYYFQRKVPPRLPTEPRF
jgi:O-antigen/teichoic acid export membrane protein